MQIIRNLSNDNKLDLNQHQFVLSIGNFDGVHLGHQYLIKQNVQLAQKKAWKSVVLTFEPHPAKILKPTEFFELLFDKNDSIQQLDFLGVDYLILQEFDKKFALLTASEFLVQLFSLISIKAIILGPDFCFGLNRSGNLDYLKNVAEKFKFDLIVPNSFKLNDEIISTSGVKKKLAISDFLGVQLFLGRNYYLKGLVIQGDQRGRCLGYPTANILSNFAVHLKKGVYQTRTHLSGPTSRGVYDSITNIGMRPTYEDKTVKLNIETHIFDFSGDLYGQTIKVELIRFIRDEKKFKSEAELVKQVQMDIESARRSF